MTIHKRNISFLGSYDLTFCLILVSWFLYTPFVINQLQNHQNVFYQWKEIRSSWPNNFGGNNYTCLKLQNWNFYQCKIFTVIARVHNSPLNALSAMTQLWVLWNTIINCRQNKTFFFTFSRIYEQNPAQLYILLFILKLYIAICSNWNNCQIFKVKIK